MKKTPAMPDTNFPWKKSIDVVETIKRLVKDSSYDLATPQTYGEFRALALMAAQELEVARPRWISVKERLPEVDVKVLVYATSEHDSVVAITSISDNLYGRNLKGWRNPWMCFFHEYAITHWMPLPEWPKEEEK